MTNLCTNFTAQSLLAWIEAVNQGLSPLGTTTSHFNEIRLEDLVLSLLDLDFEEAAKIDALSDSDSSFEKNPEFFNEALEQAIRQLHLFKFFTKTNDGEYHRSICPTAYNERTGEHYPAEMARWRADYRAIPPEQQMVVATIIWMYRSGSDSIWLRRVPCTWKASEALHYMHETGCLAIWLQLVARYPGW